MVAGGSPPEEFSNAIHVHSQNRPLRAAAAKLMEAMHSLADREIKAGRMLDNGRVDASRDGARKFA